MSPIAYRIHEINHNTATLGSMGRDSKDAAIFVAGAAVGAAALFCLTKAAQSRKVITKNGKTHRGTDDTSEVAAARAEVSPTRGYHI